MSLTIDLATPEQIAGRIVGDGNSHIAVTVLPARDKTGYLLAVRRDGREYVTWLYGWNMAEDGINTWGGHYHDVANFSSAYDAFTAASADLAERAQQRGIIP